MTLQQKVAVLLSVSAHLLVAKINVIRLSPDYSFKRTAVFVATVMTCSKRLACPLRSAVGAKEKHCVRLVSHLKAHDIVAVETLIRFSTLVATQA